MFDPVQRGTCRELSLTKEARNDAHAPAPASRPGAVRRGVRAARAVVGGHRRAGPVGDRLLHASRVRETERDQYGQAGRGRGDGPGEPDRAADVVCVWGPPVPKSWADLGDAAVDIRAAQAQAERPREGGLAPPGIRARVASAVP